MKIKLLILLSLLISFVVSAQDNEILIISEEACGCLSDIEVSLERTERYKEIKTCISTSILMYQMKQSLLNTTQKIIDTLNSNEYFLKADSLITSSENNIIVIDKNYKEIEENLLQNCIAMKKLMFSDSILGENSVSDKKKAIDFYNNGQEYFNNKNYKKAIIEYKKAVKNDKNFAYAWDMIGISYRRLNQFENAIKYYNKSLEVEPKGRVPLMNKPVVYEELKEYDKAISGYIEFINVFPNDPEGYYGIGRIYHLKGDYENALEKTFMAFIKYNEINSPYARDAERNIKLFYKELKEKNQLDLFNRIAEKYNIKID